VLTTILVMQGALFSIESSSFRSENKFLEIQSRYLSERMGTLADSAGDFGMAARFARWRHTFEVGTTSGKIIGTGFGYRHEFGCRFTKCKVEDYPHAPVLSAL